MAAISAFSAARNWAGPPPSGSSSDTRFKKPTRPAHASRRISMLARTSACPPVAPPPPLSLLLRHGVAKRHYLVHFHCTGRTGKCKSLTHVTSSAPINHASDFCRTNCGDPLGSLLTVAPRVSRGSHVCEWLRCAFGHVTRSGSSRV